MSFFKLAIKTNVVLTMGSPYTMNFMTRLWRSLFFSQVIAHKLLKDLCWPKLSWCKFLVTQNTKDASTT
jgi:hypothetical protein